MTESNEEMESRHRKELKALDGQKRAALKKAKGTGGKGKKAKELLVSIEAEYDAKTKELEEKHAKELANIVSEKADGEDNNAEPATDKTEDAPVSEEDAARERKQAKARRKREKALEKERQLQQQIEEETANAGPSLRQIELEQIQQQLTPLHLEIREIPSDGHCMYRALSAHLNEDYRKLRKLCAKTLRDHADEYSCFCEFTDDIPTFEVYVDRVENSADWGGHLELRALSRSLERPIEVYSAQDGNPLVVSHSDDGNAGDNPLRLSYHRHYYALGEHYNQVVGSSG